jgi:NAD(P) transhydrogenase subunit alpha
LVTIVAPLNVPSLLAQDASELYSKNQYELLKLMLKANVITVDWTDAVIEGSALTHDGKLSKLPEKPAKPAVTPISAAKPATPTPTKAA